MQSIANYISKRGSYPVDSSIIALMVPSLLACASSSKESAMGVVRSISGLPLLFAKSAFPGGFDNNCYKCCFDDCDYDVVRQATCAANNKDQRNNCGDNVEPAI